MLAITGKSGSGKTSLALALAAESGALDPVVIGLDGYYRDLSHLPPAERAAVNFDDPEALEWNLLAAHLSQLKTGLAVDKPVYLFDLHVRARETERICPGGLVIVEGLFTLDSRIRDIMDRSVFLEAPDEVALERRLRRDVLERGRSRASVLKRYREQVQPAYNRYIKPLKPLADLIVDGAEPLEKIVERVIELLESAKF